MEKLSSILLILYFLAFSITIPTARSIDKRPEAVEQWFKNLPNLKEKVARFQFYHHEVISGKNPTTLKVAEADITATSPTKFGLIQMLDSPLTTGPEPDSKIIGRVQGTRAWSSFENVGLVVNVGFVFTEGEFNGSTLSLSGDEASHDEYREVPIIGGTGVFRLARGVITGKTVSGFWVNGTFGNGVVEIIAMVVYYEE